MSTLSGDAKQCLPCQPFSATTSSGVPSPEGLFSLCVASRPGASWLQLFLCSHSTLQPWPPALSLQPPAKVLLLLLHGSLASQEQLHCVRPACWAPHIGPEEAWPWPCPLSVGWPSSVLQASFSRGGRPGACAQRFQVPARAVLSTGQKPRTWGSSLSLWLQPRSWRGSACPTRIPVPSGWEGGPKGKE